MRVIKSKVMLDDDYKNVIVKEFAHNYTGVDSLTTPREIVKVMEDVFELHNMAEEHLYLLAMTTKIPFSKSYTEERNLIALLQPRD